MKLLNIKQIDKIIIKTFLFYFISIFFISIFIALMSVFYEYMQIIIDKNLGFDVYFRIILNCALVFSRMGCNMSIIIAAVLSFVKLSEGLEICAMKTFGVSFHRMLRSLLIPMSIICIFVSFTSHYLCPKSMKNTIDLLMDVHRLNPAVMIKEGIFNNDIPGVSIFVKKKTQNNELHDIIVYDHSKKQDDVNSNILLLAQNAKLDINKNDNSMTLNMRDGINYLELNEEDKNKGDDTTNQNIIMKFDNQDILLDMNKMKYKNGSQSPLMQTTWEIIKRISAKRDIKENNIKQIMNFIEKNRSDLFQDKDIATKKKIKNKILKSIEKNNFSDKIIDNYIDIKRSRYENFKEIENCNREIKHYNIVIMDRIMDLLVCVFFLLLGVSIGVLLKRGSFILHLIFAIFFIILHYTIDALKDIFIPNSYLKIILEIVVLLPFVLFFYIHALKDSQILNDGLNSIIYRTKLLIKKIKSKVRKKE